VDERRIFTGGAHGEQNRRDYSILICLLYGFIRECRNAIRLRKKIYRAMDLARTDSHNHDGHPS
jgi:hypothetical protein